MISTIDKSIKSILCFIKKQHFGLCILNLFLPFTTIGFAQHQLTYYTKIDCVDSVTLNVDNKWDNSSIHTNDTDNSIMQSLINEGKVLDKGDITLCLKSDIKEARNLIKDHVYRRKIKNIGDTFLLSTIKRNNGYIKIQGVKSNNYGWIQQSHLINDTNTHLVSSYESRKYTNAHSTFFVPYNPFYLNQ